MKWCAEKCGIFKLKMSLKVNLLDFLIKVRVGDL